MTNTPANAGPAATPSPGTAGEPVTVYYNRNSPMGNVGLFHTEATDRTAADTYSDGLG